jgi:hypothetical protein
MRAIYVTYLLIILIEFEEPGHNIRCIGKFESIEQNYNSIIKLYSINVFLISTMINKRSFLALLSADSISFVLGFHDRNWHWRYVQGGRNCRPPITLITL